MQAEAMLQTGAEDERPIIFEELAFLPSLGISSDSISFTAISMESDKNLCVQEQPPIPGRSTGSIAIVDIPSASLRGRFPSSADSAIINPKLPLLALLANKKLEVYDMDKKARVTSCESPDTVVYWRWVSTTMIVFVTKTAVFHWPAVHKNGTAAAPQPYKFFDRHASMKGMQMINYRTTSVPDPANPSRTMPVGCLVGIAKEGERIAGRLQLFSSEKNTTQTLDAHACSFVRHGKSNSRRLFCYATRTPSESKFHVYELSPPKDTASEKAFKRKSSPIYFPPEAAADFPVAMQVSDKHKVAYIITKYGYLHIFDIPSAELIYMNRISADTVFTTVPSSAGGIVGVNKSGQVLSVRLNEDAIVSHIAFKLDKQRLASRFAARNGWPLTHLPRQLDQLLRQGQYTDAATLIFQYPNEDLRTPETLQKFINAPFTPGQVTPAMQYFNLALTKGRLTRYETLELARAVLKQNRGDLLTTWMQEDKLDASEELGDLVAAVDPRLASTLYQRVGAHEKALRMFVEVGEAHRIVAYCDATGYAPKLDFAAQIANFLQTNPPQAIALAIGVLERTPPLLPVEKIIELFVQAQRLPELTNVFQMALKHNKPEQSHAQTRFLEMLLSTGQVPIADRILTTNALTYFDLGYISMLCEKAGLYDRAAYLRGRMSQRK
jgi:clathrin heavy chain